MVISLIKRPTFKQPQNVSQNNVGAKNEPVATKTQPKNAELSLFGAATKNLKNIISNIITTIGNFTTGSHTTEFNHISNNPSGSFSTGKQPAQRSLNNIILNAKKAEIAQQVSENKIDPNKPNELKKTPLHLAAQYGGLNKADYKSLTTGSNINLQDNNGNTALHIAIVKGNIGLVNILLDAGADSKIKNNDGQDAEHIADNPQTSQAIIDSLLADRPQSPSSLSQAEIDSFSNSKNAIINPMHVDTKDSKGRTPLMNAINKKNINELESLIKSGADVHIKDDRGFTPLHYAAVKGDVKMIKMLIDGGANLDEKDGAGGTALTWACGLGNIENAQALIKNNANVDAKDINGNTALHVAIGKNNAPLVEILLDAGADSKIKNNDGQDAEHIADNPKTSQAIIDLLLEDRTQSPSSLTQAKMVSTSSKTEISSSLNNFMIALRDGDVNTAKDLVDSKSIKDIHKKNNQGATFLHYACQQGFDPKSINFLINQGIDINVTDNEGRTARDVAKAQGNNGLVKILDKFSPTRSNSIDTQPELEPESEPVHSRSNSEINVNNSQASQKSEKTAEATVDRLDQTNITEVQNRCINLLGGIKKYEAAFGEYSTNLETITNGEKKESNINGSEKIAEKVAELFGKNFGYPITHNPKSIEEGKTNRLKLTNALSHRLEQGVLVKNILSITPGVKKSPNTISLLELLGSKENVALYKKALKEEGFSCEFKNAVALAACKERPDCTWTQPQRIIVAGPSGAGKSFGAEKIINKMLGDYNTQSQTSNTEAITTFVSIDGGIEREMSQVRNMVLQMSLDLGFDGIADLHDNSKGIGVKDSIKDLAVGKGLHLVEPLTFTGFRAVNNFFEDIAAHKSYNIKFARVETNADVVNEMGTSRAFLKEGAKDPASGHMDPNKKSAIESKIYESMFYSRGHDQSVAAEKAFLKAYPNSNAYVMKNGLNLDEFKELKALMKLEDRTQEKNDKLDDLSAKSSKIETKSQISSKETLIRPIETNKSNLESNKVSNRNILEKSKPKNKEQGYDTAKAMLSDIKLSEEGYSNLMRDAFSKIKEMETSGNDSMTRYKNGTNSINTNVEGKLERTYSITKKADGNYEIFISGMPLKDKSFNAGSYKNVKVDAMLITLNKTEKTIECERYVTANHVIGENEHLDAKDLGLNIHIKEDKLALKHTLNTDSEFQKEMKDDGFNEINKGKNHTIHRAPWKGNSVTSTSLTGMKEKEKDNLFIDLVKEMKSARDESGNSIIFYDVKLPNMLINGNNTKLKIIDYKSEIFTYVTNKNQNSYLLNETNLSSEGKQIASKKLSIFSVVLAKAQLQYELSNSLFSWSHSEKNTDKRGNIEKDFSNAIKYLETKNAPEKFIQLFKDAYNENINDYDDLENRLT